MRDLLRRVAPALLIGGLLLANLLSLRGSPPREPTPAPHDPVPTPEDPSKEPTFPALPGRILFHKEDSLLILEGGRLVRVPLPRGFALPLPIETALSPNGRFMAGFTRQGDRLFVDAVDLVRSGEVTRYLAVDSVGDVRWAPSGRSLIAWQGSEIVYEGRLGPRRLAFAGPIKELVWSPDEQQVAIAVAVSEGPSLYLLDLLTDRMTPVAGHPWNPVWLDAGLVYSRDGGLFLRHLEGQETALLSGDWWNHAEALSIDGLPRDELPLGSWELPETEIEWVGAAVHGDGLLFTAFFRGENARFGIGEVGLDGAVRLWVLPAVQGDGRLFPCQPVDVKATPNGVFVQTTGPGCDNDLYQIKSQSGESVRHTISRGLVGAGGHWLLHTYGTFPLAVPLDGAGDGIAVGVEGDPLIWDGGAR